MNKTHGLAYWLTTMLVAAELALGGVWDVLRIPYVRGVIEHLGYTSYFLVIIGAWKVPGALALVVPRFCAAEGVGLRRPSLQLHGRSGIALGGRRWREHADRAGRFHGADARLLGAAATEPQRVSVSNRLRLKAASRHGTLSPAPESHPWVAFRCGRSGARGY
jgi:hypothetical protein